MPSLALHTRQVHFRDVGAGPPVILLHASSSSGAQWRALQARLAPRFRTLAIDLLGYGGTSAWDPARELTGEDERELVEAVVKHAGGGPIHLVGHSYGGLTALNVALSGRVGLSSLTLIEPIAFWLLRLEGDLELYGEIRAVADAFVSAYRRGDVDEAVAPYIDYWNGAGAWAGLPDPVRDAIRATAGKTSREWAPAFETDLPLQALASIEAPTLVIHGCATNRTTRRICELVRAAMPHAQGQGIAGGGHMCPLTHVQAVNEAVAQHLEAVASSHRAIAA
jgi:pimeloyl-ACP methyl ester carboxylesterase